MQAGDRIRLELTMMGHKIGTEDYTVEMFRDCLGIFKDEDCRVTGYFTPLCELYGRGPESEDKYRPNFGEYVTNQVPIYMNLAS